MTYAFASDYDGTLRRGSRPSDENLQAVSRFRADGGLFGIATGRSRRGLQSALGDRVETDFAVLVSGALVLDEKGGVLFERTIPRDALAELVRRYKWDALGLYLVVSNEYWTTSPIRLLRRRPGTSMFNLVHSLSAIPDPVYGMAFRCLTPKLSERLATRINKRFGDVVVAYQNVNSVDVVPAGCSKGTGLEVVRRELGVETLAAMGDSYNDLPLLGAADVGYTFPDAPEALRKAANDTRDSVADALEDFSRRVHGDA